MNIKRPLTTPSTEVSDSHCRSLDSVSQLGQKWVKTALIWDIYG